MTREEAKKVIRKMLSVTDLTVRGNLTHEMCEACNMAIKALEQEPKSEWEHDHKILKAYSDGASDVLDKIRTEIEENAYPIVHGVNNHEKGMTLYGILQIINKYKAESEE